MTTTTSSCLLCGSERLGLLYQGVRDHFGIARGEYRFLRCEACGSATLDPLPAPDEIPGFYPPEYTFRMADPDQPALRRFLRSLEWQLFYGPSYRTRLGTFRRLTGLGSGLILEVGCGAGLFLRLLADAGYGVEGVDISGEDVAYARDRLGLKVVRSTLEDLALSGARYDAVHLFYVLEHVLNPSDTVRQVFAVLKPGGWMAFGVPVIDSRQGTLLGSRWSEVTEAPRHLTIPSRPGLERLLRRTGFSDVRSAPMPLLDNAKAVVLSLLPGAATPQSYGQSGSVTLMLRRCAAALLLAPALVLALADRPPLAAGAAPGMMMFCARK
ncbi:MAG: class I SAM-dependent methyltransferase [Candidatus Methylomirabilia bacterium]